MPGAPVRSEPGSIHPVHEVKTRRHHSSTEPQDNPPPPLPPRSVDEAPEGVVAKRIEPGVDRPSEGRSLDFVGGVPVGGTIGPSVGQNDRAATWFWGSK